jgi:hypothetical protein
MDAGHASSGARSRSRAGTDPLDADTDDDGLPDGQDTEFIEASIAGLPPASLRGSGDATLQAILSQLATIEDQLHKGNAPQAIKKLLELRAKVDGCGAQPDQNDWITSCAAQLEVRYLVDLLVTNLGG